MKSLNGDNRGGSLEREGCPTADSAISCEGPEVSSRKESLNGT